MPELPEVELVTLALNALTANRQIIAAELLRERLAPFNSPDEFAEKLKDAKIKSVMRRGKHILFDLDNGNTLIAHLRMSGRFMLLPLERENPKYTHAAFYFADDTRLIFQDQRHFGFMRIVETDKLHETKELKSLAPEPFGNDFTAEISARRAENIEKKPQGISARPDESDGFGKYLRLGSDVSRQNKSANSGE